MAAVRWSENWPDHRASGLCDGLVGDEPVQAPSRSEQPQDYLIAVCADARMVASLMVTAIVNAISPYSIGVAALSSRVKRSSVAFMASLTIRAAYIDSGRIKNIQTSIQLNAGDERLVS
jgi:hypothetical protein